MRKQQRVFMPLVAVLPIISVLIGAQDNDPPAPVSERPKIHRWLDDSNSEPLARIEPALDADDPDVTARRSSISASIKCKLDEARRVYKAGDYQRAEAIARNVLQVDPRNTIAAEIIRRARNKLLDADEKIVDVAGERRDREALLETQEHAVLPPSRLPTIRPQFPRRGEDGESIRRKKMTEKLDEHIKSMDFMKADLDWVFNALFVLTGVNIIADPAALDGKSLTIHVDDIPLRDVLDFIVRNNKGISYSVTENAIFITANEADDQKSLMYPKVYPLHHGLVSTEENSGGELSSATGGGANGPSVPKSQSKDQGKQKGGSNTKERSYIETVLNWMKDESQGNCLPKGSQYMVDDQSNQLLVLTTPAGHEQVAKFLDYFDQPAIQVLIKARVLEISAENEKQLGFNLDQLTYHGMGLNTTGANTGTSTGTGVSTGVASSVSTGTGIYARNTATITGGATSFLPGNLGPGTVFQFVGNRTDPKFQVTVSALLNSRLTKVLSEPQVLAINNKASVIEVATDFRYVESFQPVQQAFITGLGAQVPNTANYLPIPGKDEVGFMLEVTPSVGRDLKTINLHIHPKIKALAEGQQIQNFQNIEIASTQAGAPPPIAPQPTFDRTELETDVVLEDNGYVVLGGLIRAHREVRKREVPGFSRIPVLGNMFKSTSTDVTKDNLIIIVEAQIMTPSGRTYYKDSAPDDANPREGGVIHAPMQTSRAREKPYSTPTADKRASREKTQEETISTRSIGEVVEVDRD